MLSFAFAKAVKLRQKDDNFLGDDDVDEAMVYTDNIAGLTGSKHIKV